MTKFLALGDLHGRIPKIKTNNYDFLICVGDVCSSRMRNLIMKILKMYKENPNLRKKSWDIIGRRKYKCYAMESLKDGKKIINVLDKLGKTVFIVPGNSDYHNENVAFWYPKNRGWKFLDKNHYKHYLLKGTKNIIDIYKKLKIYDDFCVIGYGLSSCPEKPLGKKIKTKLYKIAIRRYNKYFNEMSILFKKAKKTKKPIIFITHNVPYNTKLDKILDKKSPSCGEHYGSIMARELIDKFQPDICIGGHMHEYFKKDNIGKTICINVGYGGEVNTYFEIVNKKVKNIRLTGNKHYNKNGVLRYVR